MKRKFVYTMYLLFASIMLIGFTAFSAVIIHNYAQNITELRCSYERELIEKRASELNGKLLQIGNVFSKAYLLNSERKSVADQFVQRTGEIDEDLIEEFLQDVITNNSYVHDIILVNVQNGKVYSKSKRSYMCIGTEYDWQQDEFAKSVLTQTGIQISQAHPFGDGEHSEMVYTFGHNIQNMWTPGDTKQYGIILINVLQDKLFPPKFQREKEEAGHYVVLDQNSQVFWGDASQTENELTAQRFLDIQGVTDRFDMASFHLVSWSGLTCVFVTDIDNIFQYSVRTVFSVVLPIMVFILLICGAASFGATVSFDKRIMRIIQHVRLLEQGKFDEQLNVKGKDELATIEKALNKMSKHLQTYIEREYIADLTMKKAQVRSLQMQINPHFMFNTLESIRSSAVVEQSTHTAQMITLLGQMYRWNLRSKDQVRICDELDYLEYYVRLKEINLNTDIELEVDISRAHTEVAIPKLSVQPIVENSLAHGYASLNEGVEIRIFSFEENGKLVLCIEDNGRGMEAEQMQELQEKISSMEETENLYHIGLMNVNQRIRLLYGQEYGMEIRTAESGQGLQVRLSLPLGGALHV